MSETRDNFPACLAFVLEQEGGYVNHPKDPGGATNMGITLATLSSWRKKAVTAEDIRALSRSEAAAIYRANYWDACGCDDLPAALALLVFDAAVHSGNHRAVMFLQSALEVPADGHNGPHTVAAAKAAVLGDIVHRVIATRRAFLQDLPTWGIFGHGWEHRLAELKKAALALVTRGL